MTSDERSYEIYDLTGGVQVMCETNIALFRPNDCGARSTSTTEITAPTGPCADGKSKILFFYTQNAFSVEPNIGGKVSLCLSQINQIYSNSQVSNNFTGAGVFSTNFVESGDIHSDVAAFSNLPLVISLRNTYSAEIVVLFTNGNYLDDQGNTIAGVAKNIGGGKFDAFVIVEVKNATTGRFTFAHEVSHLFGARHEAPTDNHPSNAHGHFFLTGASVFNIGAQQRRTLMHTLGPGQSRIEHASNPTVNFMNVATGTNFNNNATQINSLKTHVGGFFPDPVPSSFNFAVNKSGCGHNWLAFAEICDGTNYTYTWYASQNGFSWILVGTGNISFVNVPWNNALLKCEVKNASNVIIFTLQKNLIKIGNCSGYASREANNHTNEDAERLEAQIAFDNSVNYFPNPNDGSFSINITTKQNDEVKILLTDINGKVVKEIYNGQILIGEKKINVARNENMKSGIYILHVIGKSLTCTKKVVITN